MSIPHWAADEECDVVHHPNKMVFTDDKGQRHEIYMPARDFYKAMEHFKKEEWEELLKFPKWANQKYTDADNLKNVTDMREFYSVLPSEYRDGDSDNTNIDDANKKE